MIDGVLIQLQRPFAGSVALGNSHRLMIRYVDVDDRLAEVARRFVRYLGLELEYVQRPGLSRRWAEGEDDSSGRFLETVQALVAWSAPDATTEFYALPDYEGERIDLHLDPELGHFHVEIPGLCSIRSGDELNSFLMDQGRSK